MRKSPYKPEAVEQMTMRPGFSWRTVKGAIFASGINYAATANEGRSLFNLTHPKTGEIVTFTAREVAGCGVNLPASAAA